LKRQLATAALFFVTFTFLSVQRLLAQAISEQTCPAFTHSGAVGSDDWKYDISLADRQAQIVHVRIGLNPTSPDLKVQLPVWNALYQVRDFSQFIQNLRAADINGVTVMPVVVDKTTWRVPNATTIDYDFVAEMPGPFGAELNFNHAFLNLAMLLMYPVGAPREGMRLRFAGVPAGWRIATPLPTVPSPDQGQTTYCAPTYDLMVDSPVEISNFREKDFDTSGGHFRIIVDADQQNYSMDDLSRILQKIVASEISWMDDRPFQQYMFIYHFPRGPAHGGMEHAYATAIEARAPVQEDRIGFASVSAHEFFHLWNVKRIRPQSMQPIDYTKENYSPSLWFSEGVTSTVADSTLVRAGLITEKQFLSRLAAEIGELQSRPAHLTQTAEASSIDAWLEKYPAYHAPERSISYYNKGELLGILLDLEIREASSGTKSLRELFQWMNEQYSKQGRYFPDAAGVEQAAEAITGKTFESFFQSYVSGLKEIPYDDFFRTVGLKLKQKRVTVADPGFTTSSNFSGAAIVDSVDPGSDAARQGIRPGDVIRQINGEPVTSFASQMSSVEPGNSMRLSIGRGGYVLDVQVVLGTRSRTEYELANVSHMTSAQRVRRDAWLRGEAESAPTH